MYYGNFGDDTIMDFDKDNDTIDLSMIGEAIAFSDLVFTDLTDGRTGTEITHGSLTGSITILNVAASEFSEDMFNLPDGTTTSITTTENDTVQLWETPWEGTDGSDILIDGGNDTRIVGMGGNDVIIAGEGVDRIEGGAGSDVLMAEEGDDIIDGGADDDTMWGGSGADTFVFQAGHGTDTIKDFEDGEDRIDLTAFTGISGISDLTITADGTTAVIDLTSYGGGIIELENVAVSDLGVDDFVF